MEYILEGTKSDYFMDRDFFEDFQTNIFELSEAEKLILIFELILSKNEMYKRKIFKNLLSVPQEVGTFAV